MTAPDFLDEPPRSATATDYDLKHLKLYVRLLDAEADGAMARGRGRDGCETETTSGQ